MSAPDLCYFAYGSNLNADDWAWYCHEQGVAPEVMQPVGVAVLPDMQLCFDYHSPSRNGGALNIRPARGHIVHGVLYRLSAEGWDLLDQKEGAPLYYDRVWRMAVQPDGRLLPVITYEVTDGMRRDFCPPSAHYRQTVVQGLQDWKLPVSALQQAADNQPLQTEVDCVFVYGTLMQGERNAHRIELERVLSRQHARTFGVLYDTGCSFPAMILAGRGRQVRGECLQFDDLDQQLRELDSLEGFNGYGEPASLYHRTLVEVHCDDDQLRRAWCYIAARDELVQQLIRSGCWRTHQASSQS